MGLPRDSSEFRLLSSRAFQSSLYPPVFSRCRRKSPLPRAQAPRRISLFPRHFLPLFSTNQTRFSPSHFGFFFFFLKTSGFSSSPPGGAPFSSAPSLGTVVPQNSFSKRNFSPCPACGAPFRALDSGPRTNAFSVPTRFIPPFTISGYKTPEPPGDTWLIQSYGLPAVWASLHTFCHSIFVFGELLAPAPLLKCFLRRPSIHDEFPRHQSLWRSSFSAFLSFKTYPTIQV